MNYYQMLYNVSTSALKFAASVGNFFMEPFLPQGVADFIDTSIVPVFETFGIDVYEMFAFESFADLTFIDTMLITFGLYMIYALVKWFLDVAL